MTLFRGNGWHAGYMILGNCWRFQFHVERFTTCTFWTFWRFYIAVERKRL